MGTRPPVSRKGPRSPWAAGTPPSVPGAESGSIGRGLNSISPARRPPKSATRKMRCRRARRGLAQYWASMVLQARSGRPPRTIPAYPHRPEAGIGILASGRKAWRTARKSSRSFDTIAPATLCAESNYAKHLLKTQRNSTIKRCFSAHNILLKVFSRGMRASQ